jgi:hypothetical protein
MFAFNFSASEADEHDPPADSEHPTDVKPATADPHVPAPAKEITLNLEVPVCPLED